MQYRRSDYDVTNTVQVSSVDAVRHAVFTLIEQTWPDAPLDALHAAFRDFEKLFTGQYPGYLGCDTVYHDLQHTLDETLASARLLVAYERTHAAQDRLGGERAVMGVITALFHDAGYIRDADDSTHRNGAELTASHVSRSADFLARYLPTIGMGAWVPVATQIVHFTGYELKFDEIRLEDPRDRAVGHLIGTGDLIAQMSDRCYLEKCRDRLYSEFVLAGVALVPDSGGAPLVRYGSGLDVLRQTPHFHADAMHSRLDGEFGAAYRYLEVLFNGRNPYMEAIERNLEFLKEILRTERWSLLRREPPVFTWEKNSLQNVRSLVLGYLKTVWSRTSGSDGARPR